MTDPTKVEAGQVWRHVRSGLTLRIKQAAPLRVMYPHGRQRGLVMEETDFNATTLRRHYRRVS